MYNTVHEQRNGPRKKKALSPATEERRLGESEHEALRRGDVHVVEVRAEDRRWRQDRELQRAVAGGRLAVRVDAGGLDARARALAVRARESVSGAIDKSPRLDDDAVPATKMHYSLLKIVEILLDLNAFFVAEMHLRSNREEHIFFAKAVPSLRPPHLPSRNLSN